MSDSDEIGLSSFLLNLILDRNPKFKKPNLQTWGKHISRMIRLDNRTPRAIKKVIMWSQNDPFWQNNILSTEKLRKHFDRLTMEMEKNARIGSDKKAKPRSTKYAGLGEKLPTDG